MASEPAAAFACASRAAYEHGKDGASRDGFGYLTALLRVTVVDCRRWVISQPPLCGPLSKLRAASLDELDFRCQESVINGMTIAAGTPSVVGPSVFVTQVDHRTLE